jgi:hypothetical protein
LELDEEKSKPVAQVAQTLFERQYAQFVTLHEMVFGMHCWVSAKLANEFIFWRVEAILPNAKV